MNEKEKHIYNHFLVLIDESKDRNVRKEHTRNILELIIDDLFESDTSVRFREVFAELNKLRVIRDRNDVLDFDTQKKIINFLVYNVKLLPFKFIASTYFIWDETSKFSSHSKTKNIDSEEIHVYALIACIIPIIIWFLRDKSHESDLYKLMQSQKKSFLNAEKNINSQKSETQPIAQEVPKKKDIVKYLSYACNIVLLITTIFLLQNFNKNRQRANQSLNTPTETFEDTTPHQQVEIRNINTGTGDNYNTEKGDITIDK
ncbi:MAG: hypothetical protein K1X55_13155 [Chitinophagales bacterium]|nr:hypothetical protein [Chitinophagales bacterium]